MKLIVKLLHMYYVIVQVHCIGIYIGTMTHVLMELFSKYAISNTNHFSHTNDHILMYK